MCNKKVIELVCIDDTHGTYQVTEGHTYYCVSDGQYYKPAPCHSWDSGDTEGGMFKSRFALAEDMVPVIEEKEEHGEFILWSPESLEIPKKRYFTYKQARYVARQMLERHGGTWYVMRAECKYTKTCEVNKEEL